MYDALFDAYKANKEAGGSREEFLLKAAQIPGIYVPAFYDVTYKEDGTIASFAPNQSRSSRESPKAADRRYGSRILPQLRNRWFLLSKLHRIVSLWKSSVDVSVAVVSARRVMIYRPFRERDRGRIERICKSYAEEYRT